MYHHLNITTSFLKSRFVTSMFEDFITFSIVMHIIRKLWSSKIVVGITEKYRYHDRKVKLHYFYTIRIIYNANFKISRIISNYFEVFLSHIKLAVPSHGTSQSHGSPAMFSEIVDCVRVKTHFGAFILINKFKLPELRCPGTDITRQPNQHMQSSAYHCRGHFSIG